LKISREKLTQASELKLRIGNESLYFDVDSFLDEIEMDSVKETGKVELNLPRFEFFKLMLDTACGIVEEVDDNLGTISLNKLSVPYKLSLNTLIKYKIIKKL
jgi:hypothetical protein|tara:strand:- start:46 stop:351 length:306 start_codon:yes stop_codon:yes gene_type:complete